MMFLSLSRRDDGSPHQQFDPDKRAERIANYSEGGETCVWPSVVFRLIVKLLRMLQRDDSQSMLEFCQTRAY
jgi:hypothetical protein